jgi:hypothetical protein
MVDVRTYERYRKNEQFMNKNQEEDNARKAERSNVGDYIDTSWFWS